METVPEAYWQRGYVHLLRNAPDYSPREQTDDCLTELRWVYDRHAAEEARRDRTRWLALNVVGLVAATAIAARSRCARPFYASLRRTPFSSHQHWMVRFAKWWAGWDSNPHSKDYESSALTVKLPAPSMQVEICRMRSLQVNRSEHLTIPKRT